MTEPLNILIIDDSYDDFLLLEHYLERNDISVRCRQVDSLDGLQKAIDGENWNLVFSDYSIPQLNFMDCLNMIQLALPDLPVIMVTGTVGEELAVEILKLGVCDFVLKDNLTRLLPAIQRALKEKKEREERRRTQERLRESEAMYRSLFENMLNGFAYCRMIFVGDKVQDFVYLSVNEAFAKQTGLQDVTGRRATEVIPGIRESDAGLLEIYGRVALTGNPEQFEIYINALQQWHWISVYSPAREHVVTVFDVITERKRLEEQYRQSQKMEAIGLLAGGVAHDFNNILSAIHGYAYILREHLREDDTALNYVKEILTACQRAVTLNQSLLAFSRKQAVTFAELDLNNVITEFESFILRLVREDIDVKIHCNGEPLTILADRSQIEQVIMNLVANARDAMPNGGKLAIKTLPFILDQEFIKSHGYGITGEYVLLSVADSGVGMDKETQLHIFEPFFTTKEQGKGTGLGLSMVYGIVKKHNGFVNVESEPGTGTTFNVYLPIVQASTVAVKMEPNEEVGLRGGTETILVGEDDDALRRLTRRVLGQYGYRIIEAVDGQEAVNKFIEFSDSIQLVILDMIMPNKNGKAAYDEMKKLRPDLKTIFTSGYVGDIITEDTHFDENAIMIQKPIPPSDLVVKIRKMLDKK